MGAGNGLLYQIIGFSSCVMLIYMSFGDLWSEKQKGPQMSFVQRNGTQFIVDGKAFYINGWNSYWLMDNSVDEYRRPKVRAMLKSGAKMGLTVCRTWAFNDGAYNALQISPGRYDERVFKALDYVIWEARLNGIRLILSLVNNLEPYGGKTQYVKWAWEEGVGLSSSNDSFFYDPSIRKYFKNHVKVCHLDISRREVARFRKKISLLPKTLLTRRNTLTGVRYKDDATIFAWELINEPRCTTDPSGKTLQDWIQEMSTFVKSIDKNHLLTVGLEGFYGPKSHKSSTVNPGEWASNVGSDFIQNSNLLRIDFASVHIYPDQWFHNQELEDRLKYVSKWMMSHIDDGDEVLKKPVMFTEFGWSNLNKDFEPSQRDRFYETVSEIIYDSAKRKMSGAGSLEWQFLVEGMEEYNDDYGIVPESLPSTYKLITEHSCRLAAIQGELPSQKDHLKRLCL